MLRCVIGVNEVTYAGHLYQLANHQVRLPTEAEWEIAACGVEGSIYPWGDNFRREWCNTEESERGSYPERYARGACRRRPPTDRDWDIGFRVVIAPLLK